MIMSNQPKKKINWFYVVLAVVIVGLVLNSVLNTGGPTRLDDDAFVQNIGYDISATDNYNASKDKTGTVGGYDIVIQQGNTFYVLKYGASQQKQSDFLSDPGRHADFYLYVQDHYEISKILRDRNSHVPTNMQITFRQYSVPQSFLDTVLPFLYIGAIILVAFMIMKSLGSRSGLGNMGRNRATVTLSGSTRFTDVAGIEEEKEEVQEIVQFLRTPKKFLDLGARIPKGFLLVGAPGTGKTLLAKAIAGEAGVPFFSISGSDFSEMLVGVGPSRMRDLFEQAKLNAPAIIFIDEIDSIARMRGVGASGVSDENEQTLNQLLVQMDGFTKSEGVIVLAATNRPDVLDQALLRPGRFDRQIIVQMPDVRGREKILEVHSKHKPMGSDVDLKRIAKTISGFSGADIENLMNESAIIAAKKGKLRINMADITEGINKVLLGPQKRSRIITDEDKKITAYHEAGHAVVSRILQKDQVVQEVSIIPRGMAAGYTLTNEKDTESHHKSRGFLNTQLAVYMGGRVAEELFVGDICTGSSNDLQRATGLAERMVTMFGMSDKLGPLYYGKEEEIALRMYNDKHHSEALQSVIDSEIKSFVFTAEKSCKDILRSNASKVHVMANVLLQRETIYAEDINLIMEGKNEKQVIVEMEKREVVNKTQEKKDKAESDVAAIENEMKSAHDMANTFLEAKIWDLEKMVKLETNMQLARDLTREGNRPKILPTLDNLDEYANLVDTKSSKTKIGEEDSKQETKPETPKKEKTAKPKKSSTKK